MIRIFRISILPHILSRRYKSTILVGLLSLQCMVGLIVNTPISLASEVLVFEEDFETPITPGWIMAGTWSVVNASTDSDGKKARSSGGGADYTELVKGISTSGYGSLRLAFSYRISGYESEEIAAVEYYVNTLPGWQPLHTFSGNTSSWQAVSIPLPEHVSNQSSFQIRFVPTANAADDLFYVDNITLTGSVVIIEEGDVDISPTPTPTPSSTPTPTVSPTPTPAQLTAVTPTPSPSPSITSTPTPSPTLPITSITSPTPTSLVLGAVNEVEVEVPVDTAFNQDEQELVLADTGGSGLLSTGLSLLSVGGVALVGYRLRNMWFN